MIESISHLEKYIFIKENIPYKALNKINLYDFIKDPNKFTLKIRFTSKITHFRNHDYTWLNLDSNVVIINEYCPKILCLENGFYVQSNLNLGVWEIDNQKPYELIWRNNPDFSKPITQYNDKNLKITSPVYYIHPYIKDISLLFSKNNCVEISRSKIPFVATACFTDHCDFDTLENLQIQREFFKKHNIKITKGFFLNHFSKRNDNASYQYNSDEIKKWREDGHEIAYHSITQSIRPLEESLNEFKSFVPPFRIDTWIDHGFQPYNFTLYNNNNISRKNMKTF